MGNNDRAGASEKPIDVRFACPFGDAGGFRTDGFLGAWSPKRPLRVEGVPGDSRQATCVQGPNWFLSSAVANLATGPRAKVHADYREDRALAFRGYVVDPPLHQFSAPSDLWGFWKHGGGRCPNGVFATAVIEGPHNRLILRTDAFGFSPLYYRVRGEIVLFGTKPDFLVTPDTELDPLGAATVMAHNYPLGDRTLFAGIYRCPYGTTLRFNGRPDPDQERWFGAADLPDPERPFDEAAAWQVESALNQAVSRCTALGYGETQLPLTGGYDSRRILGSLLQQGTRFRSTTVRVYRKGDRDLDAVYAAQMAAHFGFEHQTAELPDPVTYAQDDATRCAELCAETSMHYGWVLSLMRALPTGAATVLDGFLGDVLANPGYRLPGADFYSDPGHDIEQIAADIAATPLHRHLAEPFHPGEAAAEELRSYLAPLASKRNVAELALVLLRQRRATALWSQQLGRPEHLMASPFADLDYIRTLTAIRPEARWDAHVQWSCLQRFHPELAAFAGSRAIPEDASPVGREGNRRRKLVCLRRLTQDVTRTRSQRILAHRLTPLGRTAMTATRLAPETITRWSWMVRTVCEVLLHDRRTAPVWSDDSR